MNIELMIEYVLRQLVSNSFPIALIFAMSRFKCSRKTGWLVFSFLAIFGTVLNSILIFTVGPERMKQVFAIVLLVPSLIFLLFATKDKPSQLLFNLFTAINTIYLTSILSHFILNGALDREDELIWQDACVRGLLFALILFLFVRYLREPYQFLATHMKKSSWRVVSVVPMLFFALVMFLGLYPHVRTDNLPAVTFLYIILGFVYFIIYEVFNTTYNLLKIQGDNDALKSQVQAMDRQVEILRQNEEQVRIYRHDIRHYIADVTALIQAGETKEALKVLGGFDERNQQTKQTIYCKNRTINAILSFYFQQAKDLGINVSCNCILPEKLPVEAAELAIVFANALENAIHACQKLDDTSEKVITVRCVHNPVIVLEITNTYDGHVKLDESKHPITQEEGHGIGTRSILGFVEKYDGVLDYKVDDKLFRLRILINYKKDNES